MLKLKKLIYFHLENNIKDIATQIVIIMEEVTYYVIDNNSNIVYSGDYEDCKEYILEADYPLVLVSEIEFNK